MNTNSASLEWLAAFQTHMLQIVTIKECLKTGVSRLAEWIDHVAEKNPRLDDTKGYRLFCESMSSEVEYLSLEYYESLIWSWGMAAEMFDLYWRSVDWTQSDYINYFYDEINDVEISERVEYGRYLFISALSYIHGWTAERLGLKDIEYKLKKHKPDSQVVQNRSSACIFHIGIFQSLEPTFQIIRKSYIKSIEVQ